MTKVLAVCSEKKGERKKPVESVDLRAATALSHKILVVEDDVSLLKLESILLTTRGYQVFSKKNGRDALDCVEKEMPDLVLLDVMLSGIDGFEVCRQIKSNVLTSHIIVILLTVKKEEEDVAMGKEVKADCYITKPFRSAMVIETIQRFLNR